MKTDVTPVVSSLPAVPESSDMILEANDDYRAKLVQTIELMKNVVSVCENHQRKYQVLAKNPEALSLVSKQPFSKNEVS